MERKLTTIFASDVVGFSKMMGENEDRTLENLKACRALTDESIISNHGRIFGSAGDSIIAEFGSPVDAVIAATDFQKNIKLRNSQVDEKDQMLFRVGLNLGDVIMEGENLYGDGVNVAARLEQAAPKNSMLFSNSTKSLLGDTFQVSDSIEVKAKGIDRPIIGYILTNQISKRSLVTVKEEGISVKFDPNIVDKKEVDKFLLKIKQ